MRMYAFFKLLVHARIKFCEVRSLLVAITCLACSKLVAALVFLYVGTLISAVIKAIDLSGSVPLGYLSIILVVICGPV